MDTLTVGQERKMADDGRARGASRRMSVMPRKIDGGDRGVAERHGGSPEIKGCTGWTMRAGLLEGRAATMEGDAWTPRLMGECWCSH